VDDAGMAGAGLGGAGAGDEGAAGGAGAGADGAGSVVTDVDGAADVVVFETAATLGWTFVEADDDVLPPGITPIPAFAPVSPRLTVDPPAPPPDDVIRVRLSLQAVTA